MAGLGPAIHDLFLIEDVDARHKAGHDVVCFCCYPAAAAYPTAATLAGAAFALCTSAE
jgi:hypothetical protein